MRTYGTGDSYDNKDSSIGSDDDDSKGNDDNDNDDDDDERLTTMMEIIIRIMRMVIMYVMTPKVLFHVL